MLMRSADDFSSLRERNSVMVVEELPREFWRESALRGAGGVDPVTRIGLSDGVNIWEIFRD